jgi:hypothetical protein
MKYTLCLLLILTLLSTSLFFNITYDPRETMIEYDGYNYLLNTQLVNDTLTLADNFTTNITFDFLYDNYAYSFCCGFTIIHAEAYLDITKIFFLTAGHCVKHVYQYDDLTRLSALEIINDCELLHNDTQLNLGVIMCNSRKHVNTFKPMLPVLGDSNNADIVSNTNITYVTILNAPYGFKDYIWPKDIDCYGAHKQKCNDLVIDLIDKQVPIAQFSDRIIGKISQHDIHFYSNIGSMVDGSGALGSFENNQFFDGVLLGRINGATELGTQFVNTRSNKFRIFYAEVLDKIRNIKKSEINKE